MKQVVLAIKQQELITPEQIDTDHKVYICKNDYGLRILVHREQDGSDKGWRFTAVDGSVCHINGSHRTAQIAVERALEGINAEKIYEFDDWIEASQFILDNQ